VSNAKAGIHLSDLCINPPRVFNLKRDGSLSSALLLTTTACFVFPLRGKYSGNVPRFGRNDAPETSIG
jgi:hypothetical protein